jgi:hypothetical protein
MSILGARIVVVPSGIVQPFPVRHAIRTDFNETVSPVGQNPRA